MGSKSATKSSFSKPANLKEPSKKKTIQEVVKSLSDDAAAKKREKIKKEMIVLQRKAEEETAAMIYGPNKFVDQINSNPSEPLEDLASDSDE